MKLGVFGGTGPTGRLYIEEALRAGHSVTAFARAPEKLSDIDGDIAIVGGELSDPSAIADTIRDQDCIMCSLGTRIREPHTVLTDATNLMIDAMKATNARRIIAVTAIGCRDSVDLMTNPAHKEMVTGPFKENWADKNRQEALLEESGLDYTILRPGGLTDEPAKGACRVFGQHDALPDDIMITRADLVRYMLEIATDQKTFGKIFSVIN